MPSEKEIEPPEELQAERPQLTNVVANPAVNPTADPKLYAPDELDAAQKKAEQQANELIAQDMLQEIDRNGIISPSVSEHPYEQPGSRGFYWKIVDPAKVRASHGTRILLFILFLCVVLTFYIFAAAKNWH